jgi:hypothetical protein
MSRDYPKGNRDPSSHRTREQIHEMDAGYNHTPANIHKRSERNQARRIVAKRAGKAAIRGKDVNHIKMVKDGGTNAPSNLNIQSPHKNRGWERDT